jgi:dipeptidase
MYVFHSDDGHLSDARLMYVPAADHEPGSQRPVYYDACCIGELPGYASFHHRRYVGNARGPGYVNPDVPQSVPIGYIPQVAHTYAYFDANYGIMNEHQLMFGECTNGSKTDNTMPGPNRLFYSAELARVALERCTKAREAVELMGHLIDTYGYYGTGETLPVADPEEAWVFEMVPGPKGHPGFWAAQKVPDGEIFVAANELRIRELDANNPDQLFCSTLHEVAKQEGWWKPEDGPLDWLRTVSLGEYNHPYYSLRRVWRMFDKVDPSKNFSPWVEDGYTKDYPFTVKPDTKLTRQEVFDLLRDHYEGTPFDMSKGVAAGPYACPYRILGAMDASGDVADPTKKREGAWERPLSVYYCTYVQICEGRKDMPDPIGGILWFGPDKPAETCFTPFYAGITEIAEPYRTGDVRAYSRKDAFWAFNFVANWAQINYRDIHAEIVAKRTELERSAQQAIAVADEEAMKLYKTNPAAAQAYLTSFSMNAANHTFSTWQELGDLLIGKYADGAVNTPGELNDEIGYPKDWIETTSWPSGPTVYEERKAGR